MHNATWWSALSKQVVISRQGGAVHIWSCGFLVTALEHLTLSLTKAFRALLIHAIAVEERKRKSTKEKRKEFIESSSQTYVMGQRKKRERLGKKTEGK